MSKIWDAFLKKYDRVYDPEANERALLERELRQKQETERAVARKRRKG